MPKNISITSQLLVLLFASTCAIRVAMDVSLPMYLIIQGAVGCLFILLTSVWSALRMRSCTAENAEYMERVGRYESKCS